LLSLNKFELRKMKKKYKNTSVIEKLLSKPSELLSTILLGNLLVNIGLSSMGTYIALKLFGKNGVGIAIVVLTFILLIIGEITPKTLAFRNPVRFASLTARRIRDFGKLFYPIRRLVLGISNYFINKFTGEERDSDKALTKEEIKTVIKVGKKEGIIEEEEEKMIRSVLSFREIPISRIMIPRVDVKAASVEWTKKQVINFLYKTKHSKIPVYKESEDKIIGVLYAKDLLLNPEKDVEEIIKPAIFVPETKTLDSLFEIFLKEERRIAIVVDEYGGTSGIITLEDILEEIFGEIYDEYEIPEVLIKKLGSKRYRIRGKTPVQEINNLLNLNLPEDAADTIAGFVLDLFQKIPEENEKIVYGNLIFTVERIFENRIIFLLVEKK